MEIVPEPRWQDLITILKKQKRTVLGLNHGDETIDVGIAEGVSDDTVIIKTPLRSERMIDRIVIGDIIIQDRNHSSPDSS